MNGDNAGASRARNERNAANKAPRTRKHASFRWIVPNRINLNLSFTTDRT